MRQWRRWQRGHRVHVRHDKSKFYANRPIKMNKSIRRKIRPPFRVLLRCCGRRHLIPRTLKSIPCAHQSTAIIPKKKKHWIELETRARTHTHTYTIVDCSFQMPKHKNANCTLLNACGRFGFDSMWCMFSMHCAVCTDRIEFATNATVFGYQWLDEIRMKWKFIWIKIRNIRIATRIAECNAYWHQCAHSMLLIYLRFHSIFSCRPFATHECWMQCVCVSVRRQKTVTSKNRFMLAVLRIRASACVEVCTWLRVGPSTMPVCVVVVVEQTH